MRPVRPSHYLRIPVILLIAGCSTVSVDNPELDQTTLDESRSLAKSFGMRLKSELKRGLETGGPVTAIRVCKDLAPQIASELSRQSGAKVTRTSLRYRNPGNAPEPWQTRVLNDFDYRAADSGTDVPLEYAARESDGSIRYMLAIRAGGMCLSCHGAVIVPKMQEIIDREYPHDRAVGYRAGDIRGAFSVTWPPLGEHSGS